MPLKQYQKYIVTIIPILLMGIIAYYFLDIVTYIVLAWILSMVGAPLHTALKPLVGNNGAAIVTLLSFFIITMVLIWIFIPPVIQQARNFAEIDYDAVVNSFEEPINDWNNWLVEKGILEDYSIDETNTSNDSNKSQKPTIAFYNLDTLSGFRDSLRDNITILVEVHESEHTDSNVDQKNDLLGVNFIDRAKTNLIGLLNPSRISQLLSSIFGALGNTLIGIMSVFFITFFFLKEHGLFSSIVRSLSPNDQEDKWTHTIDDSAMLLKRYFIGVLIQIIVITIFISTLLGILGFENALLIGFFAALMNVIPYLGPILGAAFAIIITVSSNLDVGFYDVLLPKIGILAIVFGCMQLFDNLVVQPNIFSKSVKAHPLEIFIIILVGAKLGGILGMVVAIPLYTILRVVAKVFLSEFKIVQKMTKSI